MTSRNLGTCNRRVETDEEFIEGMFSEVGMEQDHDGFHVV